VSNVRWTSRTAFWEEADRLPKSRKRVFDAIMSWWGGPGPSIEDLAQRTGMKESSVCGRVNELKEAGLISESDPKHNRSGKMALTYRIASVREQTPREELF